MAGFRYARHAAFGGGGFGLLGAAGYGLLHAEKRLARRAIPAGISAPLADGEYGDPAAAKSLRLAMLGDSSACGVGCADPAETPGALLATALGERGYRVHLDVLAVSGSRSMDLEPQVSRALLTPPDVAVISVGANDVIHLIKPDHAVPHLRDAIRRLRAAGVSVVVGTCPDLGVIRPVPQPLRAFGGHLSHRMARAQARATRAEGGVPVHLAARLRRLFHQRPADMFCHDRFHPSPTGYHEMMMALLPDVLTAIGRQESDDALAT